MIIKPITPIMIIICKDDDYQTNNTHNDHHLQRENIQLATLFFLL
jgi:hypothetical protein